MLISEIREVRGKSRRYKIIFEEEESIVLYPAEVRRLGIEEGAELSEAEYGRLIEEIIIPRARKRAMHLLERQDRTEKNLYDKLREGGYPEKACDEALRYVKSYGYIDDQRYASNYVHQCQNRKSRRRIFEDLRKKGVSEESIQRAVREEYTSSEEDQISALIEKRRYDPSSADYSQRAKMFRFLAGRGFAFDDINKLI